MRKLYANKPTTNKQSMALVLFVALLLTSVLSSYAQVRVPFTPRASNATPNKTTYNVKGDFTMVGNTNLTLVDYNVTRNNNADMEYVNVDGDTSTWNSSSATLVFSEENGAIQECSNIIYAGLYWTGRADTGIDANLDGDNNPNTFEVTKDGQTKKFDKSKVLIKGPGASVYSNVEAKTINSTTDPLSIAFPSNEEQRNMYVGYEDVTSYVQTQGIGEYFVADIALNEGNSNDNTGFYGGWGMVVVYENSLMDRRDVTVFDGHAFVVRQGSGSVEHTIDVSGFNAAKNGDVKLKLGLMAGEGDVGVRGDYFEMLIPDVDDSPTDLSTLNNNSYQKLSHIDNTEDNFFNSSIVSPGSVRDPNLKNNTGLDIAMFNIDNPGNTLIPNDKTFTRFKYGTVRDTYTIFNLTFSLNAYSPELEGLVNITSVNGNTPNPGDALQPGESSEYTLKIKNKGTEATENTVITIPLPVGVNPNLSNIIISSDIFPPLITPNTPKPIFLNGAIVWDIGILPMADDPETVLAEIKFKLTATQDCSILKDPNFISSISLNGSLTGIGAVSNDPFDIPLIQGYVTDGQCTNEAIPAPVITINAEEYIDTPPTASNPDAITLECGESIPEPDILVVTDAADNSGIAPVVVWVSDVSNNETNPEIITRTYSVTDDCDNQILVEQTITITDLTDPVIPELEDLIGQCSVTAIPPKTNDACSGEIIGTTTDPTTYNGQGEFVITWTFDDGNGNSINVPQNVIVENTENPEIPILQDLVGECTVVVPVPTTIDACERTITGTTTDPLTYNEQGEFVITWTFDDGDGNSIDVQQNVIVNDTENPEKPILPDLMGQCSVTATPPTTTDACTGIIEGTTTDPKIYNEQGEFVITWTFDDSNGNSIDVQQNVIVNNTENPETPVLEDLIGECIVVAPVPTTIDACERIITGTTTDPLTYNEQGEFVITWTFDDGNGNSIDVQQNVIVNNTENPETPVLEDLIGECNVVALVPTTIDACERTITGTTTDPLTYNEQGEFVITWTFDDGNGNSIDVQQNIIVNDTESPTFVGTLPGDIIVECDAVPEAETLTATDNCSTPTVTFNDVITNGNCTNNYTIARTWTATDASGLKATHIQIITVQDTKAPETTSLFDDVLNVSCADIPAVPELEFLDNCSDNTGITVAFEETNSFDENAQVDYQIIRTWIVTDECENQEVFTQTLNVSLDETVTKTMADPRCFDDGIIDLNNLIDAPTTNGTWTLVEGNPLATINGNIFDPTVLEVTDDFFPGSGGVDYLFEYRSTENGCVSIYEVSININADCIVLPCGVNDIVISKAVTPNGDGFNDTFDIEGIDLCGFTANVKIFNRWGALVFSSNNYTLGSLKTSGSAGDWGGSSPKSSVGSAGKLPNGTYYYIINLENSGLKPFTGPVYLGTK